MRVDLQFDDDRPDISFDHTPEEDPPGVWSELVDHREVATHDTAAVLERLRELVG